jgi:hypothetical protein
MAADIGGDLQVSDAFPDSRRFPRPRALIQVNARQ